MQDVGNGHALKKGMMPDLRTIDHLPIAFGAKNEILALILFCTERYYPLQARRPRLSKCCFLVLSDQVAESVANFLQQKKSAKKLTIN